MGKVISAAKAASMIKDNSTIGITGSFVGGLAEEVAIAIEERFLKEAKPQNITLIHATGIGDFKNRGTNHFGHEGLIKRLICGHTGAAPDLARLVEEDKIESYFLPQGVILQLWRGIASNKPVLSKVGLDTFIDPRIEGGRVTSKAKEDLVELLDINGEEWLHFKSFPINIAIIRGTYADENGNISMDKEAVLLEQRTLAMAARNSGGIVIAQVERIVKAETIHPKHVKIPATLVDYVVIAKPENHIQTVEESYNPSLSGEVRIPINDIKSVEFNVRKIIARRCAMELTSEAVVNLGIGIPQIIADVVMEEEVYQDITLTTEIGSFGGVPGTGFNFGTSINAEATIEMVDMFDFYDGGGLDIAFLGMAQVDRYGNVNVSKFGSKVAGPGGFINISQNTKRVVFCGTFMQGSQIIIENGKLIIVKEGKNSKFLNHVDQITFSGNFSQENEQEIIYVTERAVFKLQNRKMILIEIAPGVDIERDILSLMGFSPIISDTLKEMDAGIFQKKWGNLKTLLKNSNRREETFLSK